MNFVNLFRIFKWQYAKYLLALIVTAALLLIALMSCKTQQTASESHETLNRQLKLTHNDSSRYADLSTISDTRYAIVNETVWRPPDSLGNIYPCVTIKAESSAWRQTKNDITSTHVDTLTMTDDYDYDCTATEQSIREPSRRLNSSLIANRASLIVIVMVIVTVIVIVVSFFRRIRL